VLGVRLVTWTITTLLALLAAQSCHKVDKGPSVEGPCWYGDCEDGDSGPDADVDGDVDSDSDADEDPFADYDCEDIGYEDMCLYQICTVADIYYDALEVCQDAPEPCPPVHECCAEWLPCFEEACPNEDEMDGEAISECQTTFSECIEEAISQG
jgi:hypothetical protein